jgi:hypothetical protein
MKKNNQPVPKVRQKHKISKKKTFSTFTPGDCAVYDKCTLIKLAREQSQEIINERDQTIEEQKRDIGLYVMTLKMGNETCRTMNDLADRQSKRLADQTGELNHLREMNKSLLAVKPEGFEAPPSWWEVQRADEKIKEKDITIARLCSDLAKANKMLRKSTSLQNINYN